MHNKLTIREVDYVSQKAVIIFIKISEKNEIS